MDKLSGRIATSLAGRDKGVRFAIVAEAKDGMVYVADGKTHKVSHPKLKKLMHLQLEKRSIESIDKILTSSGGTADAALRKALGESDTEQNDHDTILGRDS